MRYRTKFSYPDDPACTCGSLTSPIRGIFEIVPLILDIRHVGRWTDVPFHIYFINFVQRILYKENVREICSLYLTIRTLSSYFSFICQLREMGIFINVFLFQPAGCRKRH